MESLAENNVTLFNEYVYEQLHALTACGKQTLDLLPNLFKGYKGAKDTQFLEYIREKKAKFEEGTDFLEPEILMSQASIKYQTLVEKGEWGAPSKSKAKILALTLPKSRNFRQRSWRNLSLELRVTQKGRRRKGRNPINQKWISMLQSRSQARRNHTQRLWTETRLSSVLIIKLGECIWQANARAADLKRIQTESQFRKDLNPMPRTRNAHPQSYTPQSCG
jgi:hypothetical protein